MGVPYRVLEDLAAFDAAISERFNFKTIVLFCTDRSAQFSSRFVQREFAFIDKLTGPEILAVTLEEPKGGYWRYLHEDVTADDPDHRSVHTLLTELNRRVTTKEDISRESLPYRELPQPPSRGDLREVLGRLDLPILDAPFLLLFAVPMRDRIIWNAQAYAVIDLNDASFAEPGFVHVMIEAVFSAVYATHAGLSQYRTGDERTSAIAKLLSAKSPMLQVLKPPPVTMGQFVAVYNTRTDADVLRQMAKGHHALDWAAGLDS